MKKILINAICYNNFSDVETFIDSVKYDSTFYTLNIINNGNPLPEDILKRLSFFDNVNVISGHGNIGYFPGAHLGLQSIETFSDYDTMIVCNLDLKLDENFFLNLNTYNSEAILAPSIYSEFEKRDRNPKVIQRYTKEKINKIINFYSVPFLHTIYKAFYYNIFKIKNRKAYDKGMEFYAPHGSFIIFDGNSHLWREFTSYPVFLFGEEIFVAEVARKHNQPVIYAKDLLVIDRDHASTSLEGERFLRLHNLKAMQYLKNEFWS